MHCVNGNDDVDVVKSIADGGRLLSHNPGWLAQDNHPLIKDCNSLATTGLETKGVVHTASPCNRYTNVVKKFIINWRKSGTDI
jgi:hypothetical protein